jgi:hypothetical protein
MSPKQPSETPAPAYQPTSPWTDSFQTNPRHASGVYPNGHSPNGHVKKDEDESQTPTRQALATIYDAASRY